MAEGPITLTLAHSPDSDDLVMWWPLVGLDGAGPAIDTGRFRFELLARDVEALNKLAVARSGAEPDPGPEAEPQPGPARAAYDITAISCAAYPAVRERYAITRGGGSFGEGYGPKVVVRDDAPIADEAGLRAVRPLVGVPGVHTTAFLTLSLLMGRFEHREMLFSDIPDAVADGAVGAGLLIHEAQLTFADRGLRAAVDLGAWWRDRTGLPLPLGLNVVRRDLDERYGDGTVGEVSRVLSDSIAHALAHADDSRRYLAANRGDRAEWDDPELLDRYLAMYVSGLTLDMGPAGARAIAELLGRGRAAGVCADAGVIEPV